MPSLPKAFQKGSTCLPRDIDEVEEAFTVCHELWRRSPGEGRWPFAGDGPWHMMQAEVGDIKGDWSETLLRTEAGKDLRVRKIDSRPPRAALDVAEVEARDRVTAWLQLIADPLDRKIVWLGTGLLYQGRGREWTAMARWLGVQRGPDALARRYRRALATVACRLNGWPMRRVNAMAA